MPPDAQDIADEERGVAYGTIADEPMLLDVYRPPARATLRPAVICVHGGGMWTGSRADMADAARELARAGYVTFATDYRLVEAATGRHRWPVQLDDVQRAVRWVRANAARYGVDSGRVGAYGWSAGGQLAALLGTRDTRDDAPGAGGLLQPRRVRRRPRRRRGPGSVHAPARPGRGRCPPGRNPGGGARALPRGLAALVDRRADGTLPGRPRRPDDVVPVAQSRRLVSALRAAGVEVEYAELPDAGHGDLTWSRVGPAVIAFLGRHLRPRDLGRDQEDG